MKKSMLIVLAAVTAMLWGFHDTPQTEELKLPAGFRAQVFADDVGRARHFAGTETIQAPGQAAHRPCGMAQGPDGALYVSDDVKGTIYKITYQPSRR